MLRARHHRWRQCTNCQLYTDWYVSWAEQGTPPGHPRVPSTHSHSSHQRGPDQGAALYSQETGVSRRPRAPGRSGPRVPLSPACPSAHLLACGHGIAQVDSELADVEEGMLVGDARVQGQQLRQGPLHEADEGQCAGGGEFAVPHVRDVHLLPETPLSEPPRGSWALDPTTQLQATTSHLDLSLRAGLSRNHRTATCATDLPAGMAPAPCPSPASCSASKCVHPLTLGTESAVQRGEASQGGLGTQEGVAAAQVTLGMGKDHRRTGSGGGQGAPAAHQATRAASRGSLCGAGPPPPGFRPSSRSLPLSRPDVLVLSELWGAVHVQPHPTPHFSGRKPQQGPASAQSHGACEECQPQRQPARL